MSRSTHNRPFGLLLGTMRCPRLSKVYVMTLLTLTTVTWTCLVATLLTLGVLAPNDVIVRCRMSNNGSGQTSSCVTAATEPHLQQTSHFTFGVTKPHRVATVVDTDDSGPHKLILRWTQYYGKPWMVPTGRTIFNELECPERRCIITDNRTQLLESDAILVHMRDISSPDDLPRRRLASQRWVFYLLESPFHTQLNLTAFNGLFNWTSTYSYESDLPSPYGAYTQIKPGVKVPPKRPQYTPGRSFESKTRLAAWFVTNCKSRNQREDFVNSMQEFLLVDVYGICGRLKCRDRTLCLDMLKKKYKFYLAFENSNCRQYITEKFWHNALENDIVPIVMGASKEDYEQVSPPHSFIHVDDFPSVRELSRYLRMLHKDTRLYNEYFRWKKNGYVQTQINMHPMKSQFWCDLCSSLHNTSLPAKTHWDLDRWWSTEKQCS